MSISVSCRLFFFFFQAEDGIRYLTVTGVQTCALPILYDLASLTKVVGLTTACMLLVDSGLLELDAPIERYVPTFRGSMKDRVTVRQLLTHSAGLVADLPLYDSTATRAAALAAVDPTTLVAPPGTKYVYSDLSAIVLMQAVERVTGEPFDRFLARRVFGPLGLPP